MARERTIRAGGINIRVQSKHISAEYVDLWKAFFKSRAVKVRGLVAVMIGTMTRLDPENPESPVVGDFYRFANIDPSEPWFDIETHKTAEAEDVAAVKIPKN